MEDLQLEGVLTEVRQIEIRLETLQMLVEIFIAIQASSFPDPLDSLTLLEENLLLKVGKALTSDDDDASVGNYVLTLMTAVIKEFFGNVRSCHLQKPDV